LIELDRNMLEVNINIPNEFIAENMKKLIYNESQGNNQDVQTPNYSTQLSDNTDINILLNKTPYLTSQKWRELLAFEFEKPYWDSLSQFLSVERQAHIVYPPEHDTFTAFNLCDFDKIKVVILGQDPYFNEGQAHGLCFSVRKGVPIPPSLKNVFKELVSDVSGFRIPSHGYLGDWAEKGVFLLNDILTVRDGEPNSHRRYGWEIFTNFVIDIISNKKSNVVFMLWGKQAQEKGSRVNNSKHLVLKANHPSPMSPKGFLGCKHFSEANNYLLSVGLEPIDWNLNE